MTLATLVSEDCWESMTGPDGSEVCTSTEEPSTFGGPMMGGPDEGFSSFFAFFAVLVVVVGIVGTFWKVSTARRLAEQSGMDPNDATAMTLLTDNGLEATYVASQVRQGTSRPAGVPAAERLRELEELRKQGLITAAEYAERREVIVKSL